METKVLERLKRLGVAEELVEPEKFKKALQIGPKSPDFTKIVAKLTEELTLRYDMDETVHAVNSPDDASSFLLELSSFLKELGCVNEKLMTGNVNQRLETEDDKNILLDYLTAEVRTCRLLQAKNIPNPSCMDIDAEETEAAKDLKGMLTVLQSHKPLKNITPAVLFKSIEGKIRAIMETSAEIIGKPLITDELSESQWEELSNVYQEFHSDYTIRRTMLIERADVTAQSLLWSDRARAQEAKIKAKYYETRKQLSAEPSVALIDLLAARESDVAVMEKTSNPTVTRNTQSEINSVVIGEVPDRGGRPYEQEPPPPEMPSWQKERAPGPPSFSGGRGGGGGGGRGGGGGGGPDRGGYYRGGRGGGKGAGGYTGGGNNTAFAGKSSGYQKPPTSFSADAKGIWSCDIPAATAPSGGYSGSGVVFGGGPFIGGFTGALGGFTGGSGDFAGGSGAFAGGSGGFTGGSGGFTGGSGTFVGGSGGYQGAAGGYQGATGGYQGTSGRYQRGSRGYQGGSRGYQGGSGGYQGMAGGFAGGSGGGYVEKSTPYSGMAGANVAGLQSGSSGFGNENQGDRYEGGGGNGFGGRNKGGEEFRVCKDAKDSKHNDYHQPQYSGYGHRYCYPSSGSCALPPESDSKQGQGHRGRNGNRGKGGRGGWNQSGNNSGNYQRGGYNRGKGRTERQN